MRKALTALAIVALGRDLYAATTQATNAQLYQRVEETMTNSTAFSNPFTDTELRLSVTAPAGRPLGSSFTWHGFHDGNGSGGQGGNVWKFRLLFDRSGTWTVNAGFFVPGTNTANGPSRTFTYAVSTTKAAGEHGPVYKDSRNGRRLRHADGTPWVPFAFHGSMLLDRDQPTARTWIDEHAARGVDAIAVRFHAEGWILSGQSSKYQWLLTNGARATTWPGSAGSFDYNRFDVASWRYNEQTIEYARSKGVKLSIWFGVSGINQQYWSYGPRDYPSNTSLGPKQKLFIRYFLARWATYTNWWHWTVDSEYEETGSGSLDRNRAFAAELSARNPWKALVTTHVLSNWTPGTSSEFHLATLQRRVVDSDAGATDCRSFVTDNDDYGVPVYNAEGVWQLANLTRSRVATWAHLFAGGFSHVAHFNTDGTHDTSSWGVNWARVNPRHREDAAELGKTANFFNRTSGMDIGPCVPSHGLVTVAGGNLAMCLAQPGEQYYVWVDRGGSSVRLNLSGVSGTFSVTRYRCSALGAPTSLTAVTGGAIRDLGGTPTAGFGNEYLYVLKRSGGASLTLIAPNGGETWTAGGTATVTWSSSGSIANVKIELSTNGGSAYATVLASSTPNDGSHTLTVPNLSSTQVRVRVSDAANAALNDASNANFSIQSTADTTPPAVTISTPGSNGAAFKGNLSVSGTASDSSGISRVEWQLDSTTGAWTAATGTTSWSLTIPRPSEGAHAVHVRSTDSASPSNTSSPVSRTFISDNTGPVLSGISASPGSTTAALAWTTNEPSDSRVQWGTSPNTYTGDTGVVQTGVTSHSVSLTGLAAGTRYYVIVQSADPLGNSSVSSEQSFMTASGGIVSSTTPTSYAWDLLQVGKLQYVDRTYTFAGVPANYSGLQYLMTRNDDKSSTGSSWVSFDLSVPAVVYVAHDDRIAPKPSWMSGFADTGTDLVAGGGAFSLYAKDFAAGRVTLGGNVAGGTTTSSMYTVVVRPLSGGGFSVTIDSVSTGRPYSTTKARAGALPYIDRSTAIGSLSAALNNGVLIRTANDDKDVVATTHLTFTLTGPANVYVAYDKRATTGPAWLQSGWSITSNAVSTSDGGASPMRIYQKAFSSGQVSLGGNRQGGNTGAGSNYFVIVQPSASVATFVSPFPADVWEHPGDSDGDGLYDAFEAANFTDPDLPDTDGDGDPDESELDGLGRTLWDAQAAAGTSTGESGGSGGACGATGMESLLLLGLLALLRRFMSSLGSALSIEDSI